MYIPLFKQRSLSSFCDSGVVTVIGSRLGDYLRHNFNRAKQKQVVSLCGVALESGSRSWVQRIFEDGFGCNSERRKHKSSLTTRSRFL